MVSPEDYRRAIWHSRRGMLELDELLTPFVKEAFPLLSEKDKAIYIHFLANEDTSLFHWLVDHAQPETDEFRYIVEKIQSHAATHRS